MPVINHGAFRVLVSFCQDKRSRGSKLYTMDPCQVRLSSTQESLHGIDKDGIYSFALQSAGLAQTENAFDKTIAFGNTCSKTALAPEHGKTQGPSEDFGAQRIGG
jgi:hypothetical protein